MSYLEGCTAPMRDENQLHAAVVELDRPGQRRDQVLDGAELVSGRQGRAGAASTTSSPSAASAKGATRRSRGPRSRPARPSRGSTRAASCWATNSVGEFYSVALTNNYQQADTGTKMVHVGKNTRSTIVSKGISAGRGQNSYRGLVEMRKSATGARNFSQCDSLLIGDQCGAHTFPYIEVKNTDRPGRARGHHLEDRRGPDLLLQSARHFEAGRGQPDRQRLLQRGVPRTADGIRRRGAEAARREPGGQRRLASGPPQRRMTR